MADALGVEALINLQGANRLLGHTPSSMPLSFLYAAFKGTNSPHSTVRDVVDCLIPSITAYTNDTAGQQLDLAKLQVFLHTTFGFDVPIYALQQLLPSLQSRGFVEFKRGPNIYLSSCPAYQRWAKLTENISLQYFMTPPFSLDALVVPGDFSKPLLTN